MSSAAQTAGGAAPRGPSIDGRPLEDRTAAQIGDDRYEITVRRSTEQERRDKFPPPLGGSRRVRVPKYVVVGVESGNVITVFGLPQGGDTRAEAVFWAERAESKNDLRFIRPDGWESIEGKLP